jgi:hypothetical protein
MGDLTRLRRWHHLPYAYGGPSRGEGMGPKGARAGPVLNAAGHPKAQSSKLFTH